MKATESPPAPTQTILTGDCIARLAELPAASVHAVVTSPPYWNLRDYGTAEWEGGNDDCEHEPSKEWIDHNFNAHSAFSAGAKTQSAAAKKRWYKPDGSCPKCGAHRIDQQHGSEPTIKEYLAQQVAVFAAVRRVLRDDGVCWVNLGDSYSGGGGYYPDAPSNQPDVAKARGAPAVQRAGARIAGNRNANPLPSGNLLNMPHRVAMALQADGWILRSTIIWAKGISGAYRGGSVMPESVNGTRWERCRVKMAPCLATDTYDRPDGVRVGGNKAGMIPVATWADCPGCPSCSPTGYVLKRGSWRPTTSHEYLFQFVKGMKYFSDQEAVKESAGENTNSKGSRLSLPSETAGIGHKDWHKCTPDKVSSRNPRSVLHINTQAFSAAHFATYPEELVAWCLRSSCSAKGCCPECGAQWARVLDSEPIKRERPNELTKRTREEGTGNACPNTVAGVATRTIGWRPTCECQPVNHLQRIADGETVPPTVLDPYLGSGTTLLVARKMGFNGIGIELSPEYAAMAEARLREPLAKPKVKQPASMPGQGELF